MYTRVCVFMLMFALDINHKDHSTHSKLFTSPQKRIIFVLGPFFPLLMKFFLFFSPKTLNDTNIFGPLLDPVFNMISSVQFLILIGQAEQHLTQLNHTI